MKDLKKEFFNDLKSFDKDELRKMVRDVGETYKRVIDSVYIENQIAIILSDIKGCDDKSYDDYISELKKMVDGIVKMDNVHISKNAKALIDFINVRYYDTFGRIGRELWKEEN